MQVFIYILSRNILKSNIIILYHNVIIVEYIENSNNDVKGAKMIMEKKDWEVKILQETDVGTIQKNLGQKIKIGRIKKDVTIIELSNISGMTESYLSNIENGKINSPSLRSYLKICYALNMNPADFFSDIPTMPPFDSPDYDFIP